MPLSLPEVASCYFCEIIRGGRGRWNVLAEDALTVTVLNGRQFEAGQCMVVSQRHAPTLLDLRDRELAAIMLAARKAGEALMTAFDPDGILLYQNNGSGSGQEVPHFHLHVVPRRAASDWGFGPPHIARLENHRDGAVGGDESDAPPAYRDHTRVTPAKKRTAAQLRAILSADTGAVLTSKR